MWWMLPYDSVQRSRACSLSPGAIFDPHAHTGQALSRLLVSLHTSAKLTLCAYDIYIILVGFYVLNSQALPLELGQRRLFMFNPGMTP